MICQSEYCWFYFSGHCEARPPVYTCRLPHRPLWGVKCCTGQILHEVLPQELFLEKRVGPKSCSNVKRCGQDWNCGVWREKKWNSIWHIQLMHWMKCYTFEFNYHHRVPCYPKIHILIFTEVVKVQVVFPLPSWYVSSLREYVKLSCVSLMSSLQGKTSLTWKGFNGVCLLWDVEW